MTHEHHPPFPPATITLVQEPTGGTITMPRPKTVTQLLHKLAIRPGTALVIRNGELLTPDRRIEPNDTITVRTVISRG
jgi:Sulfur transfer protein involved in thiamine biosynthesis